MALRSVLMPWSLAGLLAGAALSSGMLGCREKTSAAPAPSASTDAPPAPRKLSPEQAEQVLARVGERDITLGQYVAALERMDSFERLRYQSADRRKLLLNEMIELELLAQEARRRGLDKQPETQERLRQMLRDELFRELRRTVRSPAEMAESDVRRYYEEHRADFNEPERRRVAHIAVGNRKVAEQVLEKARAALAPTAAGGSGGTQHGALWGKLVAEYSLDKPASSLGALPSELAGDLGIVGPPGHARGGNPRVPEALRAAVFRVGEVGEVLGEIVPEGGKFHVVRMTGRTPARERRFEEAERTIRVALVQEEIRRREAELEQELRKKYPVTIDAAALAAVKAPRADGDGALPRERR